MATTFFNESRPLPRSSCINPKLFITIFCRHWSSNGFEFIVLTTIAINVLNVLMIGDFTLQQLC